MRITLIISFVFHGVIMAMSMVGLPFLSPPKHEKLTIIPIEMVTIGDETKLKNSPKKSVKIKDKPEPEKQRVEDRKVEMPPPPPMMASTMPLPDDKPKPEKKKPQNIKKSASYPRVAPRSKPRPPSQLNFKKVAALLDKREKTEQNFGEKMLEKGYEAAPNISDIDLKQQTIQITDAISKHIGDNKCWNVPAGAKGAQDMVIVISFQLSPDGQLVGVPKVVDGVRMRRAGQEFYRAAAESALRAIRKCAPYDFLPRDKYELWRDGEMVFDPSEMLNG